MTNPDKFAAHDAQVEHHIQTHGWTILGVGPGDDGQDPFCYTIGLTGKDLPELIVSPSALSHPGLEELNPFVAMGVLLNATASALLATPAAVYSSTLSITTDTTPPLQVTVALSDATFAHLENMTGVLRRYTAGFTALCLVSAT